MFAMLGSSLQYLRDGRKLREQEEELARNNPYLAEALEREKREGHRIAVVLRTVALIAVMIFMPFIVREGFVLYTEAMLLMFIAIGWLQYRQARVGYSKTELFLIIADLVLLTLVMLLPNPFDPREFPTAFAYRFDTFIYFFIILATATLAYSWRTLWGIAWWTSIIWLSGAAIVLFFGKRVPEFDTLIPEVFGTNNIYHEFLQPNSVMFSLRIQEVLVFILVAGILAAKGFRSNQLLMEQADLAAQRANLSRYFPPNTVESLASSESDIGAVKSQEVAVLFTDIVGFTKFAESHSPEEVVELLKDYNSIVETAVFENNGTLEKYIGDGVMATFGRPESTPEDALNALKTSNRILTEMKRFSAGRKEMGKTPVQVSVGLHYGPVIMGDIGPNRHMEFAVVGDTVNVASRLEAASRELDCDCVVSDALISQLNGKSATYKKEFTAKKGVKLRGRSKPINVWIN